MEFGLKDIIEDTTFGIPNGELIEYTQDVIEECCSILG